MSVKITRKKVRKTVLIAFRMDADTADFVDFVAKNTTMNKSEVIRQAVRSLRKLVLADLEVAKKRKGQ